MKIKVIFTGGTIGSAAGGDGYISLDKDCPYKLLDMYYKTCPRGENPQEDFCVEEPFTILSENMKAEYLNRLILCVSRVLEEDGYDGVIITHGTDTLQYTAAVLSYIFGTKSLPVILVSSDFPLEDDRANGLINFQCAVDFIKNGYGRGVFASYCNQGGNPVIHRGTRLLGHIPYSADMYSVRNLYYGEYIGNAYIRNEAYISGNGHHFDNKKCYNSIGDIRKEDFRLCENAGAIMWIRPCVGMVYSDIPEETRVILHDSYHSGTISVGGEFERFMKSAEVRGIPVYMTGVPGDEKAYETVRDYQNLGVRILPEISPIAAYCKLWLALSSGLDPEQVMESCIAEDFC